ncbi:hypothetical protein [Paludibaculum fermentans]|uniref:hypothetical protein n=1 Tax=Paludibaculum fermentans TaxID=1473598 RepID=UPI003EC075F3
MPTAAPLSSIRRGLHREHATVASGKHEFWWLVFLESTLFFSQSFWESGPPYAEPSFHPWPFTAVTLLAATIALFLCHLGPAFLAARRTSGQLPQGGLLLVWLAAGYLECIPALARSIAFPLSESAPFQELHMGIFTRTYPAAWLGLTAIIFLLGWTRAAWRPFAAISFGTAVGLLAWSLSSLWHGLGVLNPYFSRPPSQLEWLIGKRTILAAAPAIAIAWRLGAIASNTTRIWISGVAGLWFPVVLSLLAASLAAEAGSNLHWQPTLVRGFYWALFGPNGRSTATAAAVGLLTLLAPALVCACSLRLVAQARAWPWKSWLLPMAAIPVILVFSGLLQPGGEEMKYIWDSPFHDFWTASVLLIGAATWVVVLLGSRPHPPQPGTAESTATQYPAENAPPPPEVSG